MEQHEWWIEATSGDRPVYLYHYTSSESILAILSGERLRLGPFRSANDPYEFELWLPILMGTGDPNAALSNLLLLKNRLNRIAFATDRHRPTGVPVGSDVHHRGFGSLPMWAHYGDRFQGACLVFNRDQLVEAVENQLSGSSESVLHGPVTYVDEPFDPPSIGVSDKPIDYLVTNKAELLFRKHMSWNYEGEYRIVTVARTECPQHVTCGSSMVGIVVGAKSLLRGWKLEDEFHVTVKTQLFQNGRQLVY